MLETGLTLCLTESVTEENTAAALGSGGLAVYATPAMALLMEKTCYLCAEKELGDGQTSVGTALELSHLSATPVGMEITCRCELTAVSGRELVYSVECADDAGLIGKATHRRFIVDKQRFVEKAQGKLK